MAGHGQTDGAALRVLASPALSEDDGNPYIGQLNAAVRATGTVVDPFTRRALLSRPDIVHVHWPEFLVRWSGSRALRVADVAEVLALLRIARWRGARLVWTAHNLQPQDADADGLRSFFLQRFASMADLVISLTKSGIPRLRAEYPALQGTPIAVVRHGHYRDAYPAGVSRSRARAALDLSDEQTVFLTLGQLRRYKNVTGLVRSFTETRAGDEVLAVVGEPRDLGIADDLVDATGGQPGTRLDLRRVGGVDLVRWHAASDVVVLPYNAPSVLNSGAAILSLSLGRPVVVTDSGPMRDLQAVAGKDWVRLADGSPADALRAARRAIGVTGSPDLSELDWTRIANQTVEAYRSLLDGHQSAKTRYLTEP